MASTLEPTGETQETTLTSMAGRMDDWRTIMKMKEQEVSHEEIARRAYEILESRGCPPGDGTDDWQTATEELMATRIDRNGSTQHRMQSWWKRVQQKIAGRR